MADQERQIDALVTEATSGGYSRRDIIKRGLALGLSVPAIKTVLASGAFAQEASPAAGGPVMVPIVGREMTHDEIAAAIAAEGEITVGNWTYTANDQLVARFQNYVKETYGADITLNYQASQSPSTYLTDLYTAVGAGDSSPYDVLAIEENYWAEVQIEQEKQGVKLMEDFLPSGLIPNADRDRVPSLGHSRDQL